jgi:hypothetical protein
VTGLPAGTSVTLLLNGANGQTVSNPNGTSAAVLPFTLASELAPGASYAVTVGTVSAAGYACSVSGGNGTIAAADVSNVAVTCGPPPHNISGYVTGLPTGSLVTLLLNGANSQIVSNPSGTSDDLLPFTFPSPVASGGTYAITVDSVSVRGYGCTVNGGSGTMPDADVSGMLVSCNLTAPVTLGGTVTGLDSGGPYPSMLVMLNSDAAQTTRYPLTGSGAYSMGPFIPGSLYFVSVDSTGTGYSCFVVNINGAANANVSNIDVSCRASSGSGFPPAPMGLNPAKRGTASR